MNLMSPLNARLEDDYCSITVANHRLIIVIRFVAKNYIHPWNDFANRLHLVLHARKIFFPKNMRARILVLSKQSQCLTIARWTAVCIIEGFKHSSLKDTATTVALQF